MSGRVDGKVACTTGATRGMGRNHAVRTTEAGGGIIAVDKGEGYGSVACPMATAGDLKGTEAPDEKAGGRIVARRADVHDRPRVDRRRRQHHPINDGGLEPGPTDATLLENGVPR